MTEKILPGGEVVGLCGYDGANWQRLNLLFGYYDRYIESKTEAGSPGGTRLLSSTSVPAGEVWVITNIQAFDTVTTITMINFNFYDGVSSKALARRPAPLSGTGIDIQCNVVLKAGDRMDCYFIGVVAGDNLWATWVGYKMKVS